jgi:hypothetical protein
MVNRVYADDYAETTSLEYRIVKDVYGELGFSEPYNTKNGWLKFYRPERADSVDTALTFQYSAEGLAPSAYYDHTELPVRMLEGKTARVKITNETPEIVSPLMIPLVFSSEDLGWVWDDSVSYDQMSEWKWDSEKNDWVEKPFLSDGEFPDLLDVLWLRVEAEVYSDRDKRQSSHVLFEEWMVNYDRGSLKTETPIELQKDWYIVVTFIATMYSGAGNEYQNLPAVFGMNFELSSREPEMTPQAASPTAPARKPRPPFNTPEPAAPPEVTQTGAPTATPAFTPAHTPTPRAAELSGVPSLSDGADDTLVVDFKPIKTLEDDSAFLGDGLNPGGNTNPPGMGKDEMPKTGELPLAVNVAPGLMTAAYGLRLMKRSNNEAI